MRFSMEGMKYEKKIHNYDEYPRKKKYDVGTIVYFVLFVDAFSAFTAQIKQNKNEKTFKLD